MGLLSNFGRWLGLGYASQYSDNSHLADITLEDWLGALPDYVAVNPTNAMQIGTVANARHVIAGTTGRLALYAERGGARVPQTDQPSLLAQPERGVPAATTMTQLAEQLFWYPNAFWVVTERDYYQWPTFVHQVSRDEAEFDSDGRLLRVAGQLVKPEDVIRFDSPLGAGFLKNAGRTIQRSLALDLAAAKAEDNPVPTVELHNEGDAMAADKVEALLDAWSTARRKRGVAYTPKNIKVIPHGAKREQLLIEGRRAVNLELVRHASLPAWAASSAVEGATMTYDNRSLRNWELIDLSLAGYFASIAGRLSLNDVTPRGWTVKLDTDDLTKEPLKARFEAYEIGKRGGFIDNGWIAEQEGWASVPADTTKETP